MPFFKFKPTEYRLENARTGRIFDDTGWLLSDPESPDPALVRAVYSERLFTPRPELRGLYRYAGWLPVSRTLKGSAAPVTYKSRGLARYLGLSNLYISLSGYVPRLGAKMKTCSFKETEAFSVCARIDKKEKRTLIVQSAGNTARAFAQVCSDNDIPVVICIPEDNIHDLWFHRRLNKCVKVVAVPRGCDYYDAITLGEKLATSPDLFLEGGAKNIARRDGMGTTLLSFAEKTGRIPDVYFQAVGSGTGAIAAWENAERLAADGRFGENKMRIYVSQNSPFTLIYDSWKACSRSLAELAPDTGRRNSEVILAKVLSNRKPPYSIAGGLYDVLIKSRGEVFTATNDEVIYWLLQFRNLEGYDLLPAACVAVSSLATAVREGRVGKDELIMLNCTGGGLLASMGRGYLLKEPDLVLSPELPAEEIVQRVKRIL